MSKDQSTADGVIGAEQEWLRAHRECDLVSLERMMADEYAQIVEGGEIRTKEEVLATFRAGDRHWDRAESDELDVRVYNDFAVVIGRWRAKGVNAGRPFDYAARYVSVWVYRDERWQMVSDQATSIL
jgi:ketosteroid isomerase-like protein